MISYYCLSFDSDWQQQISPMPVDGMCFSGRKIIPMIFLPGAGKTREK
jgi:hypothetical protein